MLYRDLIADRCGGRYIGSHIRIPDGGPVGDWVHFHEVRVQLIYCHRGWVRVVYEDQGEPVVMEPGDCVLQPPLIRHRVLECSEGLEVIELAAPAEHRTRADTSMTLPTGRLDPERDFSGQRFVHHRALEASWIPVGQGLQARDLRLRDATGGLADARVIRGEGELDNQHEGDLSFWFALEGSGSLDGQPMSGGDAITVASGAKLRARVHGRFLNVNMMVF